MGVAVTGVRDHRDIDATPVANLGNPTDESAELRNRYTDVLEQQRTASRLLSRPTPLPRPRNHHEPTG
jgi:hypothetical protein